jgi:hypothetical protein
MAVSHQEKYNQAYDGLRAAGFDVFLKVDKDEWDRQTWILRWKKSGAKWSCEGWEIAEVAHKAFSWLRARENGKDERRFASPDWV